MEIVDGLFRRSIMGRRPVQANCTSNFLDRFDCRGFYPTSRKYPRRRSSPGIAAACSGGRFPKFDVVAHVRQAPANRSPGGSHSVRGLAAAHPRDRAPSIDNERRAKEKGGGPDSRTAAQSKKPAPYKLPNNAAVSDMRLEKPHSLSYQPITRASPPSTTAVCVSSNVQLAGLWLKSIDTSFARL